jgi:hypothetical protein
VAMTALDLLYKPELVASAVEDFGSTAERRDWVRKKRLLSFCASFILKTIIYQDRLGTNIGKFVSTC